MFQNYVLKSRSDKMWKLIEIDEDGNITEETRNASWEEIRDMRNGLLDYTDQYMWSDRFDLLTETQKTELLTYRQELRELPVTGFDAEDTETEGANNTLLNLPIQPDWMN